MPNRMADAFVRELLVLPTEDDRYHKVDRKRPRLRIDKYMGLADQRRLANLIDKYGLHILNIAASLLPKKRGRGRPIDPLGRYHRAHVALWINDRIRIYESQGHKHAVSAARTDYFYLKRGNSDHKPNRSELEAIKRFHQLGKRELERLGISGK